VPAVNFEQIRTFAELEHTNNFISTNLFQTGWKTSCVYGRLMPLLLLSVSFTGKIVQNSEFYTLQLRSEFALLRERETRSPTVAQAANVRDESAGVLSSARLEVHTTVLRV
jgi:hypothetical protein